MSRLAASSHRDGAAVKAVLAELLPDPLFYRLAALVLRWQEAELRHLRAFVPTDRLALDVGAWWGPWTFWLSRHARGVVAVEPQPLLADFLRRVVNSRVDVRCIALSDVAGIADLVVPSSHRGQDALAHLLRNDDEAGATLQTVSVARIDDLGLDDVGFIKIDVEGHEQQVIAGAAELLERDRPTILVEIEQRHLGSTPIDDVFASLRAHGYSGLYRARRRWCPLETFDVERDQLAVLPNLNSRRYVNNFLFVP